MPDTRVHRPPPAALVSALAMERWKAQEVLDLLGGAAPGSSDGEEGAAPPAC